MLGWIRAPLRLIPRGWRTTAIVITAATGTLLLVLGGVLVRSILETGGVDRSVLFYTGDCDQDTPRVATVLQLLLNVIATGILASSNFFIQVLHAPSRAEVVAAHAKGSWLAIGVRSWRNMFQMSLPKKLLCLGFLISSIPIHLFANSMLFQIDKRESYFQLTAATESFMDKASWYPPGGSFQTGSHFNTSGQFPLGAADYKSPNSTVMSNITEVAADAKNWQYLTPDSCTQEIATCRGVSSHQQFLVVMDEMRGWNKTDNSAQWLTLWPNGRTNSLWFYGECEVFATQNSSHCTNTCDGTVQFILNHARYCMARQMAPQCRVGRSNAMLLATTLCVLVNLVCCVITITFSKLGLRNSLVTIGDAVAAFITDPDPTLDGKTLQALEKRPVKGSLRFEKAWEITSGPQQWNRQGNHRGDAATFPEHAFLCLFFTGLLIPFPFLGVISSPLTNKPWGFKDHNNILPNTQSSSSLISGLLVVNSPQLYLAIGYTAYNMMITRFEIAREWALLSTKYQSLRVSNPSGLQRSSFYLQLRCRYGILMLAISAVMHWLLSEAFFAAVIEGDFFKQPGIIPLDTDPNLPPHTGARIGYALLPLLLLIVTLGTLLFGLELLSRRKLPGALPVVGSNSRAIAASCQVAPMARMNPPTPTADGHVQAIAYGTAAAARIADVMDLGRRYTMSHASSSSSGGGGGGGGDSDYADDGAADDSVSSAETSSIAYYKEAETRRALAESEIRWGCVKMPRSWYKRHDGYAAKVHHLSFGAREDGVEAPFEGCWHA